MDEEMRSFDENFKMICQKPLVFFYNRRLRKTQTHTATQKKITQHDKTQVMTRNRIQLKNTKMN